MKTLKPLLVGILKVLVLVLVALIWFQVLASVVGIKTGGEISKLAVNKQWNFLLKVLQSGEVK